MKITASDVSSTYKLSLVGADGADTFIGGAGADISSVKLVPTASLAVVVKTLLTCHW